MKTLEALDFNACFMEHENFITNPDGRLPLHVITGEPIKKRGTQCPARIQDRRPHCNHSDRAREIMIDVAHELRRIGVLSFNQAHVRRRTIRRIGGQQEAFDVEGRGYIHNLPVDQYGMNPEMEQVRCDHDRNRERLERIKNYLIAKIEEAIARLPKKPGFSHTKRPLE